MLYAELSINSDYVIYRLNVSFAGTTGGILMLAFVVDIVVWYKAGSISFVEEQEGETGTAEEMATLKSQDAQAVENDYL